MKSKVFQKPRLGHLLCGVASGLMLYLSFPPADLSFLAWIAAAPILWLAAEDPKKAVVPAYAGGAIWFLGGLAWVRHATGPGMILLGLFLAVYLVGFAVVTGVLRRRLAAPLAIIAPIVWVSLEGIRSNFMTGFPYLLLGHTLVDSPALVQILDVTGVYGASFVVMSCSGLVAEIAIARRAHSLKPTAISLAIVAAAVATALIYSHHRLKTLKTRPGPEVCVVQPSIPQDIKAEWTSERLLDTMARYERLTSACLENAEAPSPLLIWPESALPGFYNEVETSWISFVRKKLNNIMRENKIERFIIGMNTSDRGPDGELRDMFNSALYLHGHYDDYERYDKIHLVPFGEYVPLARLLFFIRGVVPYEKPFAAGSKYKLFDYNDHKFGILICYEDVFPGLVRRFVAGGAEFLVNISNEGWFFMSAEAEQHLAIARCRAIEARVGMVRATNSGISCLIGPDGRVEKIIEKDGRTKLVAGSLAGRVTLGSAPPTLYTRFGDVFALLCIAGGITAAAAAFRRNPR